MENENVIDIHNTMSIRQSFRAVGHFREVLDDAIHTANENTRRQLSSFQFESLHRRAVKLGDYGLKSSGKDSPIRRAMAELQNIQRKHPGGIPIEDLCLVSRSSSHKLPPRAHVIAKLAIDEQQQSTKSAMSNLRKIPSSIPDPFYMPVDEHDTTIILQGRPLSATEELKDRFEDARNTVQQLYHRNPQFVTVELGALTQRVERVGIPRNPYTHY